ncbi:MAG: acyl carrier protein [Prevotellaceae bacterium]|jgi:acyl carrier protein|nr:acyl carrier protein [Prevotellaceae bacterium]
MEKIDLEEIKKEVNCIVMEIIESESSEFDESLELINDLEFDSMCFLELSIQIQREFGVIISAPEWEKINTLSKVYETIYSKLKNEGD